MPFRYLKENLEDLKGLTKGLGSDLSVDLAVGLPVELPVDFSTFLQRNLSGMAAGNGASKNASAPSNLGQLELPIAREVHNDRNAHKGGRSFYFFDFDDNVAFLATPTFIFHKQTGKRLQLSSGEFAKHSKFIGRSGSYKEYRIDLCETNGTFRCFRDQDIPLLERLVFGRRQMFIEDLAAALGLPDYQWKGPSWSCFHHATLNQRPMSVITARGHRPETIKDGVRLFVREGHLPNEPNYLSLYPVSNKDIRLVLGDPEFKESVAAMKQAAIRASVETAIRVYGYNPHHRFGMSDDDPQNIELIVEEMTRLKTCYPEMSFFVIETQQGHFVKWEIYRDRTEATLCTGNEQTLGAFEQLSLLPTS